MTRKETEDLIEGESNRSPLRREWTDGLDPATRDLLDEDARWFLHQSLSTPCVEVLEGAKGSHLVTRSGRRILDFHGNSVHQAGYGHPKVLEAVRREMERLPFCPRRYTNRAAIELARTLAEITPGDLGKSLFAPAGSLAIGMALKLARAATGRHKTVSWHGAFHGASLDAASVGGEELFRRGMGPMLPGAIHVPPPGGRRDDGSRIDAREAAERAEEALAGKGDVAAFVAEPIRCTTAVAPPAEYWERIRAACDLHGTLLVFDEIPTGLGRTGRMFACEHYGVVPDILCLGKGLGGGLLPMAAMVVRKDLDVAGDLALGHYTHEKSHLGAAAALATIALLREEDLPGRAARMGTRFRAMLGELAGRRRLVGEVRGIGLLFAVELARGPRNGKPAAAEAERVLYACLRRGLSFKVTGGDTLSLVPPLTVSEEELERAVSILDAALAEAER